MGSRGIPWQWVSVINTNNFSHTERKPLKRSRTVLQDGVSPDTVVKRIPISSISPGSMNQSNSNSKKYHIVSPYRRQKRKDWDSWDRYSTRHDRWPIESLIPLNSSCGNNLQYFNRFTTDTVENRTRLPNTEINNSLNYRYRILNGRLDVAFLSRLVIAISIPSFLSLTSFLSTDKRQ